MLGDLPIIKLSDEEKKAIASLERLAKRWPKTISLFADNGLLCVNKTVDGVIYDITSIPEIEADGGDPSGEHKPCNTE